MQQASFRKLQGDVYYRAAHYKRAFDSYKAYFEYYKNSKDYLSRLIHIPRGAQMIAKSMTTTQ